MSLYPDLKYALSYEKLTQLTAGSNYFLLFPLLGAFVFKLIVLGGSRVAEVAREHGWHPPKSLDSDENFKPEHTLFCRELRFVAICALFLEIFGQKKCLFG